MMRRLAIVTVGLLQLIATDAKAVDVRQSPPQVAAPTRPVVSKNLDVPIFQSDTKNLQAIVDKDQPVQRNNATALSSPAVSAPPPAAPAKSSVPLVSAKPIVPQAPPVMVNIDDDKSQTPEEEGALAGMLTGIRVFAIRWHDVFDIAFTAAVLVFIRKLYVINREQYKIMAHCARASEDAARAARKSADIAEAAVKNQMSQDEAQGKLDLR